MTPPSGSDFDLKLYDTNQSQVDSSNLSGGRTDNVEATALASGYFYIYVYHYSGTGTYSMTVNVTTLVTSAPPPPPGDTVPPPTPSLVSPVSGANITDNTPLFDWSDVSDPSGVTYDMSIARDAGFVSIALQKTGLTASTYELTPAEALAAGAYFWRARAVDGVGNIGSWSENWSFVVSAVRPPAAFTASGLIISPSQVSVGEEVSISVTVTNTGGTVGTCVVTLTIGGTADAIQNVTINGGSERLVTFTVTRGVVGIYSVDVDGLTGSFSVVAPPTVVSLSTSAIFLIAVAVIGGLLGGIAVHSRMRRQRHDSW
jgi:hypothetical protein